MIYLIFYFNFLILSFVGKKTSFLKLFFLLSLVLYSVIFGLRFDIGADFFGYISYFNSDHFQYHIGPAYYFLSSFFRLLELQYFHLNIFLVFLNLFIIYLTFKNEKILLLSFFVFICLYFLGGTLGQIRQSLGFSLILYAFYKDFCLHKRFFLVITAGFFHYGAFAALILLFINNQVLKHWFFSLILIVLAFFLTKIVLVDFFSNFLVYFDSEKYGGDNSISFFGIFERFLVTCFCLYCLVRRNKLSFFAFYYLIGVIIFIVYFDIEIISQRMSRFFKVFDIVLIPYIFYQFNKKRSVVITCCFLCVLLFKPVHVISVKPSQYLPFKTIFHEYISFL